MFKSSNDISQSSNEIETKIEEPTEVQTETPKYDPNVDRFKDVILNSKVVVIQFKMPKNVSKKLIDFCISSITKFELSQKYISVKIENKK